MTRAEELVASIALLEARDLDIWVAEEMILADRDGEVLVFTEVQCARVRLLCTLRYELEVEDESLPLVMSLIDELYDARGKLLSLSAAVASQPAEVRATVLRAIPADTGGAD